MKTSSFLFLSLAFSSRCVGECQSKGYTDSVLFNGIVGGLKYFI